ncbi:hypothetical protein SEA_THREERNGTARJAY_184 [Mycobacterium phage ThreeRngTarjay]|nr:hypothetical protein SEA_THREERNGTARJAY_184 [Mycobacterium phage ThreeRngTarjay]
MICKLFGFIEVLRKARNQAFGPDA